MKNNKKILIFALVIFFLCLLSVLFFVLSDVESAKKACIYSDGELYEIIYLTDNNNEREFVIETEYGFNKIKVSDGRICVLEADCPDKTCVNTGWTNSSANPVICVPHRLEIVIEGTAVIDGVSG